MNPTRDQVKAAYAFFLNREPEDEAVVDQKMRCGSLSELMKEFVESEEFRSNNPDFDIDTGGNIVELKDASRMLYMVEDIARDDCAEPSLEDCKSQLCSAGQFFSPIYARWCAEFNEVPRLHRKQWEYVYILRVLDQRGFLNKGKRGLGFGCGKEPLPAVMAKSGCTVVATDLDTQGAVAAYWAAGNQHSSKLDDLYRPDICSKEEFEKKVSFLEVDMNHIPSDLQGYDFVWSSCAFEHLGSIEKGLEFVVKSADCLNDNGVAVHTTEFNLGSNQQTFESEYCVIYRKQDMQKLQEMLYDKGFSMETLNLAISERVEDNFVDLPPYKGDNHLKLALYGFVSTSIGIIVTRR